VIGGLFGKRGVEEHAAGAAVEPDLFELTRAEARIDRNGPGIELADRKQDRTEGNAVLARHHHPVARPDLQVAQIAGRRLDGIRELPVAP